MYSVMARNAIEAKAERQLQRARQGRPPKGQRLLGYLTNGDVIEHQVAAVREIYRLFAIQESPTTAALAASLAGEEGPDIPKSVPRFVWAHPIVVNEFNQRREPDGLVPKSVLDDKPRRR